VIIEAEPRLRASGVRSARLRCGCEHATQACYRAVRERRALLREILRLLGKQLLCLTLHEPGQRGMVERDIGQAGTQISRLHVRS
jgi:hypothetical protein